MCQYLCDDWNVADCQICGRIQWRYIHYFVNCIYETNVGHFLQVKIMKHLSLPNRHTFQLSRCAVDLSHGTNLQLFFGINAIIIVIKRWSYWLRLLIYSSKRLCIHVDVLMNVVTLTS